MAVHGAQDRAGFLQCVGAPATGCFGHGLEIVGNVMELKIIGQLLGPTPVVRREPTADDPIVGFGVAF